MRARIALASFLSGLALTSLASEGVADWPMWRADPGRTACTAQSLALPLQLRWTRQCRPNVPAWPDQPRLRFDTHYEPVVMGKLLIFGSARSDCVTAVETETGVERWRTHLDGPVRFAPAAWRDRLFVACDDGYLYCLAIANGKVLWRLAGSPQAEKKVLGNSRLISAWPVRGAPVVSGQRVYFAAGIWPFMGIFVHCVDALEGTTLWCNSGTGAEWRGQPHIGFAFTGPAPQGYLALNGNSLLVPNGRAVAACFDADTGNLRYYHIVGNRDEGEYFVATANRFFFNRRTTFEVANGAKRGTIAGTPVLTEETLYCGDSAFDLRQATAVTNVIAGRTTFAFQLPRLWKLDQKGIARVWLRAGNQLFLSTTNKEVLAFGLHETDAAPALLWQTRVAGTPASIIAGDGKLFVVTYEGAIHCYGPGKTPSPIYGPTDPPRRWPSFRRRTEAQQILRATGISEGYCLYLGPVEPELVEDLLDRSELHMIVVDENKTQIETLRRRLDDLGLYGTRAAAHAADPVAFRFPPYLASLVILSPPLAHRLANAEPKVLRHVFGTLKPWGGVCVLRESGDDLTRLEVQISTAEFEGAALERKEGYVLLARKRGLPGAGRWTHENGDVANTVFSRDTIARAPLGLLWFGGSTNEKILPRHGHGPIPHVVNGRIIIEGPDTLRAMDVYTGRVLWDVELPGLGRNYNVTYHQAGAIAVGSNYVSLPDSIYVVYKDRCLRLDPATGRRLAELALPKLPRGLTPSAWGYIGILDDVLLAGVDPQPLYDPDFTPAEFPTEAEKIEDTEALQLWIADLAAWVDKLRDFKPVARNGFDLPSWLAMNLNKMLRDRDLGEKLDLPRPPSRTNDVARTIRAYLRSNPHLESDDLRLRELNRTLLCLANPNIPVRSREKPGSKRSWTGAGSRFLIAMDRISGKLLWHIEAQQVFLHNAIAAGNGKVFCLDSYPPLLLNTYLFTGRPPEQPSRLLALDAKSGRVIWSRDRGVFGTWLSYSEEYDALLQARRPSRDALDGRSADRLAVYRGSDGTVLWDKNVQHYGGPCILHGRRIITQNADNKGEAWDLLTGQPVMRIHPLTGSPVRWRWERSYGCGTALASQHLLTFRSGEAGFYDLLHESGTANLGGFRAGCTPNMIVADGVVAVPDYTRTCSCSYVNQCSVGLVHDPEVELWSYNRIFLSETQTIMRVGLNLGAPGDRLDENGTLWLEWPPSASSSPNPRVTAIPERPRVLRHHTSLLSEGQPRWVAASGVVGLRQLSVQLVTEPYERRSYTLQLHFAELESCSPGERVFSVNVQDRPALKDFDVVATAGRPLRGVIQEIKGVVVTNELTVRFEPLRGEPLLCGIEIQAD